MVKIEKKNQFPLKTIDSEVPLKNVIEFHNHENLQQMINGGPLVAISETDWWVTTLSNFLSGF